MITSPKQYVLEGNEEDFLSSLAYSDSDGMTEILEYSPLYQKHVPVNTGTAESKEQVLFNGNIFHLNGEGDVIGCSVCLSNGTLAGESPNVYLHYNLDGTLAGLSYDTDSGAHTLSGSYAPYALGRFNFKMPAIKVPAVKMPKIKVPKFKAPKIKVPKVKIPRIRVPKVKIPKIKAPKINTSAIGKAGAKIGKAVDTAMSKYGEAWTKAGEVAQNVVSTGLDAVGTIAEGAGGLLNTLIPRPSGAMPEEEAIPDEEMDALAEEALNEEEEFSEESETEFAEEIPEESQTFQEESEELYGENKMSQQLGFLDPISLSAIASVGTGLLSNVGAKQQQPPKSSNNQKMMETMLKLQQAKAQKKPVRIVRTVQAKPAPKPVASPAPRQPLTRSMNPSGFTAQAPQPSAPQTPSIQAQPTNQENKNFMLLGAGAVVLIGGIILMKGKK